MTAPFTLPSAKRYALRQARLLGHMLPEPLPPLDFDGFAIVDILVDEGAIAKIVPTGVLDFGDASEVAMSGRIVLPLFVDVHTHLDKGHIWRRKRNPIGNFASALAANIQDRAANWSAADVAARMEFSLRCAFAHGTTAIRTHIDSVGPQTRISWPVVAEARARWLGRIDLQTSPLFTIDHTADPSHMADVEEMLDAHGTGILGAVTRMAPNLHQGLGVLFELAERKGWELDFHVDESSDPAARSLKVIADMAIERRFARPILVGHCCSLALQEDDERRRTIDAVARAGLNVVSLPMCNMFLQDREAGRTPRWRGVTALHEFKRAGVNVMIASDNTRDPFYPYGDLDMMEVWREGVRILHLDYPFADWAPAVSASPAKAMGLDLGELRPGRATDMIVTQARDFTELLARPQSDRIVVRNGEASNARPPDYSELDALEGLAP
ncbi:MAG TPA: cytosine deaminase [Roseiarcus sp.]|jgi:cytosine deaminase|nr:cytosine deaminase [Roseiarcus sp.]